jgi:hypothetical protein
LYLDPKFKEIVMKTSLPTQATITKAILIAVFFLFLLPVTAIASGNHHSGKLYSGKKCEKQQCDTSLSVPLYISGEKRVGKVTVRLDQYDLKVTYQVDEGWTIKQTNLDIADNYNSLHVSADGVPQVEAFPYKTSHYMPVKSAEYSISARQWPLGTQLYLSAQAVVVSEAGGKCQQRTAGTRHENEKFSFHHEDKKRYGKDHDKGYGKGHGKDHGKRHDDDSGREHYGHDDHDGKHHGESDDDQDHSGNTVSNIAWAVGQLFPGQQSAAYFTYTLKSCDTQQQSTIQFSDAIYSVNEGDAQVLITVVRSGNIEDAASVDYTTVDASAVNGVDYVFAHGTVNFVAGQASAQFAVTPIDDTEVENTESLTLQLSSPVNAVLGLQNTAILEIMDNDVAPASVFEFSQAVYTDLERIPVAVITVVRSGDLSAEAQVDFNTADGTAMANSDYIAKSGTLVFPAGVNTVTFQVLIINDRLVESDETILLQLSNPVGAAIGAQGDATLVIQDDDGLPS